MIEVTKKTIRDFDKLLIELGGFHELRDDGTIWRKSDGEQIAVPMGKHNLPLVLFEEGMPAGSNVLYLNPFSEGLGAARDREWFYDMISKVIGGIIKAIILETATNIVKKADNKNYDTYQLINKVGPYCDENFIKEAEKIQLDDYFLIFYNKSRKTAEAQCAIFTDEFRASHNKFRKKTWDGLAAFYLEIFRTVNLEEAYHYQSQLISIPETDAKLQIACAVINDLDPYSKDILGIDLHSKELMEHLPNIEGYGKLYSWAILRRGPVVEESKPVRKETVANGILPSCAPAAPFNQAAPSGGVVSAAMVGAMPIQQMQPVGMPQPMHPVGMMQPIQQVQPVCMMPVGMPGAMQPVGMMPTVNLPGSYNPATGYTPGGMFGGYR